MNNSNAKKCALVLGPKGVTGFSLVERLINDDAWGQVITLSRSPLQHDVMPKKLTVVSGDLFNVEQLKQALAEFPITHIFFAAHSLMQIGHSQSYAKTYFSFLFAKTLAPILTRLGSRVEKYLGLRFAIESEKYDPEARNLRMLTNILEAVKTQVDSKLEHISLVTGVAYNGIALGPYFHPNWQSAFIEDCERIEHYPCFYYQLEDALAEKSQQYNITHSIARPGFIIIGYGENPTMNFGVSLAAYACILKEMGEPLHFPGTKINYEVTWQMSTATDIASIMIGSALDKRCDGQAINVANTDVSSWSVIWPQIAAYFGMEASADKMSPIKAQLAYRRSAKYWTQIAQEHDLPIKDVENIADLSMLFKSMIIDWNYSCSLEKLKKFDFPTQTNTAQSFFDMFQKMEQQGLIPKQQHGSTEK